MRFDPDFSSATQQAVPIDRAVTLLMPAGFSADQFSCEPAVSNVSPAALPDEKSGRVSGLRKRVLGFLSRSV